MWGNWWSILARKFNRSLFRDYNHLSSDYSGFNDFKFVSLCVCWKGQESVATKGILGIARITGKNGKTRIIRNIGIASIIVSALTKDFFNWFTNKKTFHIIFMLMRKQFRINHKDRDWFFIGKREREWERLMERIWIVS